MSVFRQFQEIVGSAALKSVIVDLHRWSTGDFAEIEKRFGICWNIESILEDTCNKDPVLFRTIIRMVTESAKGTTWFSGNTIYPIGGSEEFARPNLWEENHYATLRRQELCGRIANNLASLL